MDNRLRETAVTVAVWASSQHAISEVWFAGPRVASAQASPDPLEIVIVMADHAQQVEARKAGRPVSTLTWEADIKRAVRGPHTFKLQNAGVDASAARAIRIFSRRAEVAPDIVCPPPRSEQPQTTLNSIGADARGDIGNVRPL